MGRRPIDTRGATDFAVAMILRRLGKLDRARAVVEPMIRESARRRGGLTNMVVERVVKERR